MRFTVSPVHTGTFSTHTGETHFTTNLSDYVTHKATFLKGGGLTGVDIVNQSTHL